MNFDKAYKELMGGKRIRRKGWEPLMHLFLVDKKVKTFKGEYTSFYGTTDIILSKGWKVLDGDGKELSFLEALEELKTKKQLTNVIWEDGMTFIFVDGENLAMCRPIEFEFMPTFKCFCSNDWEIMK